MRRIACPFWRICGVVGLLNQLAPPFTYGAPLKVKILHWQSGRHEFLYTIQTCSEPQWLDPQWQRMMMRVLMKMMMKMLMMMMMMNGTGLCLCR